MKILILGHKGMLGSMVCAYFKYMGIDYTTTDLKWPTLDFEKYLEDFKGDYIVNCIAITNPTRKGIQVNYELPKLLEEKTGCRIIYPGTDSDNEMGSYAASKTSASIWINQDSKNTKIIRSSIIGPELTPKPYLFEFLIKTKDASFSEQARLNGNTTLTWAKYCLEMIQNWNNYTIENVLCSSCITKAELAEIVADVFDLKIDIKTTNEKGFNRCLKNEKSYLPIKKQLIDLKEFIYIYNQQK